MDKHSTFNKPLFIQFKKGELTLDQLKDSIALDPKKETNFETTSHFINSNYEQTDLRLAISFKIPELVDHLISLGYSLKDRDCYGHDVFCFSFCQSDLDMAEYLLIKHNDKIDFENVSYSNKNALSLLLEKHRYLLDDENIIKTHKKTLLPEEQLKKFDEETLKKIGHLNPISYYDLFNSSLFSFSIIYDRDNKNEQYLRIYSLLKDRQKNKINSLGLDLLLNSAIGNYYFLPQLIQDGFDYSVHTTDFSLALKNHYILLKSHTKSNDPQFYDFSSFLLTHDNCFFMSDKFYLLKKSLMIIKENGFQFGYEKDIENTLIELEKVSSINH